MIKNRTGFEDDEFPAHFQPTSASGEEADRETGISEVNRRLQRIEEVLSSLVNQQAIKEWYTTAEVAELLEKAEFTVREWCRLGRIHADKRCCGRGSSQEWMIAYQEVQRIRNEGLLPNPRRYRHVR